MKFLAVMFSCLGTNTGKVNGIYNTLKVGVLPGDSNRGRWEHWQRECKQWQVSKQWRQRRINGICRKWKNCGNMSITAHGGGGGGLGEVINIRMFKIEFLISTKSGVCPWQCTWIGERMWRKWSLEGKEKQVEWFINVDIEFTMNNGNSCGGKELCGNVFHEIKEVTRR